VLAIQDTSEINFRTRRDRTRGLGEIGKGNGRGALLHAMLAVDADSEECLGLVGGDVWTRSGRVTVAHGKRAVDDKESRRWLRTAERAKDVLAAASAVTVIADRESDIYAEWASLPQADFHLLTRVMKDRRLTTGGLLYAATAALPAETGDPRAGASISTCNAPPSSCASQDPHPPARQWRAAPSTRTSA
jgi:hypothetical protein